MDGRMVRYKRPMTLLTHIPLPATTGVMLPLDPRQGDRADAPAGVDRKPAAARGGGGVHRGGRRLLPRGRPRRAEHGWVCGWVGKWINGCIPSQSIRWPETNAIHPTPPPMTQPHTNRAALRAGAGLAALRPGRALRGRGDAAGPGPAQDAGRAAARPAGARGPGGEGQCGGMVLDASRIPMHE